MKDASYVINGKRWRLEYQDLGRRIDGDCDPPATPSKKIRLNERLSRKPETLLETIIHECLHAADWTKDDADWVEPVARDIARVLWDQGFRLQGD